MRVALAQLNQTVGDFEGNSRRMKEAYRQALAGGADLVVFSELSLWGYPPLDLLERKDFLEKSSKFLEQLASDLGRVPAVVGCALADSVPGEKRALNAAVLLAGGKIQAQVFKTRFSHRWVLDERRYFEPGFRHRCWQVNGKLVAVFVGEEIKEETDGLQQGRNILDEVVDDGVDLVVNISALPFEAGKFLEREQKLTRAALKVGAPVVLVNQVGGNDQVIFDGRSMAIDAQGRLLARAAAFQPEVLLVDLEAGGPIRNSPCGPEELYQALVLGLRDFALKCGVNRAVLGLSGGIDSALCAVLAAEALGAQNVYGLAMPSPYTSQASVEDASELADRLGIAFAVLPIAGMVQSYRDTLRPAIGDISQTLVEENLQARIRCALVMAFANKLGALALATGNKSELATGYCTMYGDLAGAIAPIGDLLKTQVYQLARWINRERQLIPRRTIERSPSAELRPGQLDTDSLPPYDQLDPILDAFLIQGLGRQELIDGGFPPELVDRVLQLVSRSEFKRHQAPPVLRVTSRAFGTDWNLPIARSLEW